MQQLAIFATYDCESAKIIKPLIINKNVYT